MSKSFHIGIFLNAINVINVKCCMNVPLTAMSLFIPLLVNSAETLMSYLKSKLGMTVNYKD